jgi:hypothetical protein
MAKDFFKIANGLKFPGLASAPSDLADGDIYFNTTLGKFRQKTGGVESDLGGGSGSDGSVPRAVADGFRMLSFDSFTVPPSSPDSKIDNSFTSATYNTASAFYEIKCDKSKTITATGTNFSISGAPTGFSLAVGQILWVNAQNTFRRVASVLTATTGTLDAAFPVDPSAEAGMISQAVWTKDLINLGSATEKTRPRDFFPNTSIPVVNLSYSDSLIVGDATPDFVDNARVVCSASNYGLQTDVTYPTTDKFSPIFTRPNAPNDIQNYSLADFGNKERLFLCFFPNPNEAAVTTQANILEYEVNFYEEATLANGGILDSAFCMTDGSGTPINCSNPFLSGGLTRVTLGFNFTPGVNAGKPDGDLEVNLEGQRIPRYYPGVVGAYWKEVVGSTNTIEFHANLSSVALSIHVIRRQGVVDTSTMNATKIAAMADLIVGSAAQVAAGQASHSSLQAAHDAMTGAGRILMLVCTIAENVTWTKTNIMLEGKGRGSVLNGNLTVNNGAVGNLFRAFKVNNVTFNAGADGNFLSDAWIAAGFSVTDNGTGNQTNYIQET